MAVAATKINNLGVFHFLDMSDFFDVSFNYRFGFFIIKVGFDRC